MTRPVARVEHPPRLPVWPVAAGVAGIAAEAVGLRSGARWLERRFGGRVQPMSLGADPFLLLVHHVHTFSRFDPLRPLSALVMAEGFPAHPHRGFETVTILRSGGLRHRDSAGVKMVYRGPSAQWLTAGDGVLHEEMWVPEAGRQDLYQLWLDVPRAHRRAPPVIQLLGEGTVEHGADHVTRSALAQGADGPVDLTVYGGRVSDVVSPARTLSPVTVARATFRDAGTFRWTQPADHTALTHVTGGSVWIGDREVGPGGLVTFGPGDEAVFRADAPGADLLLLAGAPLRQGTVSRGSFVGSSQAELDEAERDYAAGHFGHPWDPRLPDDDWRRGVGAHHKVGTP